MSIEQKLCKVKKFQVCVQEFWYCLPNLYNQPELSEIDNSAPKKTVRNSSRNMTIHMQFFFEKSI